MSKRLSALTVLLALVLLVVAACGGDDDGETAESPAPAEEAAADETVSVTLAEQNASGQSGTATLTPTGEGQLVVTVELSNPPENPQPIHIHMGTCEELGEVVYPLSNVEGGSSETTVDASLTELQGGGFAINAHESEENIQNYVACGPIE